MIIPHRAALVPIDVQMGFDEPPWGRRNNPDMERKGLALLAAWRESGRPVIHVRHDSVLPESSLRPDRPGNRLRPGFEPRQGEPLVSKSVNAAFIGTDLDLRLRRAGIDTVVLFGISTDMCVSTTARVAANLGYRAVVVGDACACFDLPDEEGGTIPAETVHRVHLATLRFEFATVTDAATVIAAVKA